MTKLAAVFIAVALTALPFSVCAANSTECQKQFEAAAAKCKADFDVCHCQKCPGSKACGGQQNPNSCDANKTCIDAQRACRDAAKKAKDTCLGR